MKRNKFGLAITLLGAAGFVACLPSGEVNSIPSELLTQNTEFLVVLPGTTSNTSAKEIKNIQNTFFANLNHLIGSNNYTVVDTYDAINVVKIKANEAYLDAIDSIKGVNKVSINQTYSFSEVSSGAQTEAEKKEGYITLNEASADATASTSTDNTNISAQTMNVPEENAGGEGSFVAILDSGYYLEHTYFANFSDDAVKEVAYKRFNYDTLKSISGELVAQPSKYLTEEQAKDLNYQSTDRADGTLYWNLKIPFYYDYGASSESSANDFDVLSTWSEHGTHVASITGANGTYDGIAPNTQLALMKVFYESIPADTTSVGGVYAMDDDILEALNDCVVLGIDALNMSLGTDLDDFTNKSASMDVINKLEEDGVSCNIAAGNGGKNLFSSMGLYKDWSTDEVDTGVLGSYANSTTANIIASNTTPKQYYETGIKVTTKNEDGTTSENVIAYDDQVDYTDGADGITPDKEQLLKNVPTNQNGCVELVTPGIGNNIYGTAADYTTVANEVGDPDYFKGKIAVVDRGSNSFVDKAEAAQDAGCVGLIVINNDPTAYEFNFGMSWAAGDTSQSYNIPEIPVVFVLYRDRQSLIDSMNEVGKEDNPDEKVCYASDATSISLIADQTADNPNANQLSDFSSEGATSRLDLTPTISAPGSSIRGAILGKANSQGQVPEDSLDPTAVGYLNGTSMATPNYTGIVALLVGEKQKESLDKNGRLMTNEEKSEYLRSLTMRTMSTADQYEYTNTVYDTITSSKATTTDDYHTEVTIYEPKETHEDTAPYSPRKQGAGVVNAADAINSDVYLEGLVPDSKTGEYGTEHTGNNFAKIELRNNDKIANGTISLGVRFHNEGTTTKTYKATLKVMAPLINKYHNHDNELANYVAEDAAYEGAELQTSYDTVLGEVSLGEVSVPTGTTDKIFEDYTVTDEMKEYLAKFSNGTYLEGYLVLDEVGGDENSIQLTIPYMGFYGDYEQAEATEPFDFEKEDAYDFTNNPDGMVYGSELVNYVGANSYLRSYTDMSSTIAGDSYENYNANNRKSGVQVNSTNINYFAKSLTYTKDSDGKVTLYVGSDTTDVLYIQEFVYRSLLSENVQLIDETGKVVSSKYVTDIISNGKNLYKSHIGSSYISDYSLAHRGYCELPLYTEEGNKIADGKYTLKFTYSLVYGSTQTKEFNVVIDSKAPQLTSKSIIVNSDGSKTLRLKFNEIYIPSAQQIHVNADTVSFTYTKVGDGYYVDIPLKDITDTKLFINVGDSTYNSSLFLVNINDVENGLMIESDSLNYGTNYTYTKTSESTSGNKNISDRYVVTATDYSGKETSLGEFTAYITYDKKVNLTVRVYGVKDDGTKVALDVTKISDTTIKFTTTYSTFTVEDGGVVNDNIAASDNATVSFTQDYEHGTVYVDKVSGIAGEIATVYAIPDSGYRVTSVKVNGVEIARDLNGNYQFQLNYGVNTVEVTFEAI